MKTLLAMIVLGLCLPLLGADKGKPLPKDFKPLRILAEKGVARAQYELGRRYANGLGVEKNKKEAVEWYRKAALQGHAGGQYGLGIQYMGSAIEHGTYTYSAVVPDIVKALAWWILAAKQGHKQAIEWKPKAAATLNLEDNALAEALANVLQNKISLLIALSKADSQKLTSLRLGGFRGATPITDAGLKEVAKLKNLTELILSGRGITDAGLKQVAKMENLTLLELNYTATTDAGLKELAKLKQLTELGLSTRGREITDAGLKEVAKLEKLTSLWLSGREITDAGLKEVAKLKNLTSLELSYTATIGAGLKELTKLENLKSLYLYGTKITDGGITQLKKALPKCNISKTNGRSSSRGGSSTFRRSSRGSSSSSRSGSSSRTPR